MMIIIIIIIIIVIIIITAITIIVIIIITNAKIGCQCQNGWGGWALDADKMSQMAKRKIQPVAV